MRCEGVVYVFSYANAVGYKKSLNILAVGGFN